MFHSTVHMSQFTLEEYKCERLPMWTCSNKEDSHKLFNAWNNGHKMIFRVNECALTVIINGVKIYYKYLARYRNLMTSAKLISNFYTSFECERNRMNERMVQYCQILNRPVNFVANLLAETLLQPNTVFPPPSFKNTEHCYPMSHPIFYRYNENILNAYVKIE